MSVTLNSIDLELMESEVLGRDARKQFVIAVCISSFYGLISILGSLASNDQCRTIGGMSEVAFSAMVGSYMVEQKSCAIPFFLKAGQASEIKNTIYLIILFCYDSFHSGTESLVTSAGRGAKVRHID